MYGSHTLVPTYENCFLQDTNDALLIVQSVIDQKLPVTRARPTEQNRRGLIKSGNVFVIDMKEKYISRWTDGLSWSPSRILGDFLIYRERRRRRASSRGSIPSGAVSKNINQGDLVSPDSLVSTDLGDSSASYQLREQEFSELVGHSKVTDRQQSRFMAYGEMDTTFQPQQGDMNGARGQSSEYSLYGSLTSNDQYKEDGLIKKTFSVAYKQSVFRLISYYLPKDVETGKLRLPSRDPTFADIHISDDLSETKNVRVPVSVPQSDLMHYHPLYDPPASRGGHFRNMDTMEIPFNPLIQNYPGVHLQNIPNIRSLDPQHGFHPPYLSSYARERTGSDSGRSGLFTHGEVTNEERKEYDNTGCDQYFKNSPKMREGVLSRSRSVSVLPTHAQLSHANNSQPGHFSNTTQYKMPSSWYTGNSSDNGVMAAAGTTSAGPSKRASHVEYNSTDKDSLAGYDKISNDSYGMNNGMKLNKAIGGIYQCDPNGGSAASQLGPFQNNIHPTGVPSYVESANKVQHHPVFYDPLASESGPLQGATGNIGKIAVSVTSPDSEEYESIYTSEYPGDQSLAELNNAEQNQLYTPSLSSSPHVRSSPADEDYTSSSPQRSLYRPATAAPYDLPQY